MNGLKQGYWSMLAALKRWRDPSSRSLSPHPWMDAIEQHVDTDRGRLVMIDGGAHDGAMAHRFLRRFGSLEVHAFEPNADLGPALETNLAGVPGTRNALALAAETRPLQIIINASPMTSSILPRNVYSERFFDAATRPRQERTIEATTLDDWCDATGVDHVDILKLDLQGYEAEALKGAQRVLRRGIAAVYLEVNFVPFYEGCALFADVDAILRPAGYRLYNLYNLCTHLPSGQIGAGDALFVFESAPQQSAIKAA